MKNLFFVRLIVIFLFASLAHIDMVNAQNDIRYHPIPKNVNKADRKELDKKLAEFDTLQLRREPLLLNYYGPANYSFLYLDKSNKIRKYEYMLQLNDGAADLDSTVCYYDSDGKLLKYAYEDGCDAYFQCGFFYVKNGRIVDYDTYFEANYEDEDYHDNLVGDTLASDSFVYLNLDSLTKYLKDMGPDMYDHPSDYSYFERPEGFSYKAIDSYAHNWVHFSTPFKDCNYKLSDWTEIDRSTTPTYGKLNEISQMPLKKYLMHYVYYTYGDVNCPQERKNISYLYVDSLNRVRKCEAMFKDDEKDNAMSCFFDEDGTLLYVSYYNGSESGYFYVKDSLLCGECKLDEYGPYKSWTSKNPFKLEEALKNHEILMFPLSSCLHVTMLEWTLYGEIRDKENQKTPLPPYVLPIPLQQPY